MKRLNIIFNCALGSILVLMYRHWILPKVTTIIPFNDVGHGNGSVVVGYLESK